jgi:hypothetical protein
MRFNTRKRIISGNMASKIVKTRERQNKLAQVLAPINNLEIKIDWLINYLCRNGVHRR